MDFWIKLLMRVNVGIYRLSHGWVGGQLANQSVLLLHTIGRKSGRRFTTPISYFPRGGDYVLVASNWGRPRHPDWYFNLMAHPKAEIQVKRRKLHVRARKASAKEREELWPWVKSLNAFYGRYESHTQRSIPIVFLEVPRETTRDST